jgi:hypothetical protein
MLTGGKFAAEKLERTNYCRIAESLSLGTCTT